MKQEVSRRHAGDKWALDDVVLTSEVTHPAKDLDGIKEAPAEGVYVYGLFLDACAWSAKGNRLIDSEPKKLFNPLPVLYVTGVQVHHVQHPSSEKYEMLEHVPGDLHLQVHILLFILIKGGVLTWQCLE